MLSNTVEHVLHHRASRTAVLHLGIDTDWPDSGDWCALVLEVAAGDAPVHFDCDSVKARIRDHGGEHAERGIERREFAWKVVLIRNRTERAVADVCANWDVLARRTPNLRVHVSVLQNVMVVTPRPWSRAAFRRGDGLPRGASARSPRPARRGGGHSSPRCSRRLD